jgi:hypothetical protein
MQGEGFYTVEEAARILETSVEALLLEAKDEAIADVS